MAEADQASTIGVEEAARSPKRAKVAQRDVFDRDDFDATAYINEMFPTGAFAPAA